MATLGKKAVSSAAKKLEKQNTTVSKGATSIGSRPYSSPNTTTNAVKNTATTTTTAPKSSTPTIGARPYSSPNASTANQGVSAVGKGNGYTSLPYSTPNANLYNNINNTASVQTPSPAASLTGAVGGLSNAAQNAAPYAAAAALLTGGASVPNAASAIQNPSSVPTSNGNLMDSIVRSQLISGGATTDPINNVLGNGSNANINVARPYSNPNYDIASEEDNTTSAGLDNLATVLLGASSEKGILPRNGKSDIYSTGRPSLHGGGAGTSFDLADGYIPTAEEELLGKKDWRLEDALLDSLSSEVPSASPYSPWGTSGEVSSDSADATATAKGGSSSGGSGSRYGGNTTNIYGGLGDGSIDVSALYDLLNQRLGEYEGNYTSLLDLLANNYGGLLNALGLNYSDTEALLNGQFTNSKNELEAARRRALQEAYISRMMQEKSLSDQLDAYGLTGGAAESVMANMRNNYANNRYQVEENLQNNLRDLLMTYLNNLSGARQRYNDSLVNAQTSRFNALADALETRSQQRDRAYGDLYDTLANLTMKGINYGR